MTSTVDNDINHEGAPLATSIGAVLRQAREVRQLSAGDAARAAGISPAYLSRLENDAVKKPSPHVLHRLSEVLTVPYSDLLRLSGHPLPDGPDAARMGTITEALFADLTDEERDELLEYLAWYRARRRLRRANGAGS
jgi:transcriptional regulator with XRE-family HTH domain